MSSSSEIILDKILVELREIKKLLKYPMYKTESVYKSTDFTAEELERITRAKPGEIIAISGKAPQKEIK